MAPFNYPRGTNLTKLLNSIQDASTLAEFVKLVPTNSELAHNKTVRVNHAKKADTNDVVLNVPWVPIFLERVGVRKPGLGRGRS